MFVNKITLKITRMPCIIRIHIMDKLCFANEKFILPSHIVFVGVPLSFLSPYFAGSLQTSPPRGEASRAKKNHINYRSNYSGRAVDVLWRLSRGGHL